jgi:hypothetical protein
MYPSDYSRERLYAQRKMKRLLMGWGSILSYNLTETAYSIARALSHGC